MSVIRIAKQKGHPSCQNLRDRARDWLDIKLDSVRMVSTYLLDFPLEKQTEEKVIEEILLDPVLEKPFFSYQELGWLEDYQWLLQIGLRPGMKDGEGERAKEAIESYTGDNYSGKVYTAQEYLLAGEIGEDHVEEIANHLLANQLINRINIISVEGLEEREELLNEVPRVEADHDPQVKSFDPGKLEQINENRNLALSADDIRTIRSHFQDTSTRKERQELGLGDEITDVELEIIAQTQSEHCKHKIFNALITYKNHDTGEVEEIDSLMDSFIQRSTREIDRDWILSTFWDNAGVIEFDDDHGISMKFETHNSPSAKEPYGGSITGIVGVYRDPMGTGLGSRIIAGAYGFCTPDPFYEGPLKPEIPPKQLLRGVVEGVRDGGNKSGVPTITGYSYFDDCFLGKPLVYVGALGLIPKRVAGGRGWEKDAEPGDLIVMVGGRVGRDGIHGVTESSLEFGEHITSGHVQIGDPFTQKKAHDFLLEARDRGLYRLIWDLGGGGLSSAVGETAQFSGGCKLELDRVPLKYQGLDPWEIVVSESQERMLLAVSPDDYHALEDLADIHDVEVSRVGQFTDQGKFEVLYDGDIVGSLDLDFLHEGFPQYELNAEWRPPDLEPVQLSEPQNHEGTLLSMLSRPNIASKEWIQRQYDHEVGGNSVIKPLVGENHIKSDSSAIKPVPDSPAGIALGLANNFKYSQIDPYWTAASSLEEAIRRVVAVGADPDYVALNDNFCWPNSIYDPQDNPEGRENLGKLVRAAKALYRFTKEFRTPCISGKDSMFIDGTLKDDSGGEQKVSGLPALQFSALGRIEDINQCVNLVPKKSGDLLYVIGETHTELGGSEYYEMCGEVGATVPQVNPEQATSINRTIYELITRRLIQSCHGLYRGGLGVGLAEKAMAGSYGIRVDLREVPRSGHQSNHEVLYSETPSRFLVSVKPEDQLEFEQILSELTYGRIGKVISRKNLRITGIEGVQIADLSVDRLLNSYKGTFEGF